jgi:hypothetical protein
MGAGTNGFLGIRAGLLRQAGAPLTLERVTGMLAYGKSLGVGAIAVLGLIPLCLRSAPANTYTWDASGNGSAFDGGGNWDTFSVNWWNGGTGADQAWNNSTNDTAVFGTGAPAANSYTVTLDAGSITAAGVIFQNQSYTLANSTLNLGPGGINASALTGGTTTIASSVYLTDGAQTWSVGNGAALAITGGVSRAVGATVNFNPAASGAFLTTALTNDSTGIVGPWATYGTGASAQYATVTGGAIGGLSQAPVSSLSGNNGSTNYTFSGSSVAGSTYVNTVTYTGPSASISVGLYNFGFNGFLAAGSAPTVTIGSSSNYITLGNYGGTGANSTGEMIIGGPQNVTMPGIVYNGALVYNGQGVLSLTNASNSYSGGTYITSGAVAISSNANLGYGNLTLDGGALNTQLDCGNERRHRQLLAGLQPRGQSDGELPDRRQRQPLQGRQWDFDTRFIQQQLRRRHHDCRRRHRNQQQRGIRKRHADI